VQPLFLFPLAGKNISGAPLIKELLIIIFVAQKAEHFNHKFLNGNT